MSLRIALLAVALATAAPAFAAQAPAPANPMAGVADVGGTPKAGGRMGGHGAMKACKADRAKYCAGVERGGGKVRSCMQEHAAQLSAGCKQAIQTMSAERKAGK